MSSKRKTWKTKSMSFTALPGGLVETSNWINLVEIYQQDFFYSSIAIDRLVNAHVLHFIFYIGETNKATHGKIICNRWFSSGWLQQHQIINSADAAATFVSSAARLFFAAPQKHNHQRTTVMHIYVGWLRWTRFGFIQIRVNFNAN